ncbi:MAG: hypothetical protein WCS31_12970 [Verrucomicrobiae bacterium]
MNEVRALVVDGVGAVPPDVAMQDACLRAYLQRGSFQAVADSLGISVGLAHRHVCAGSAYLREAGSQSHRAAVLGLVEGRCNHLWQVVDGALSLCGASGQVDRIASLAAVGAKLCELLARFHGVGGFDAPPAVVDVNRLSEVARRVMLAGPHSKAARMAARSAMDMAGVKGADVRDVSPEGKS